MKKTDNISDEEYGAFRSFFVDAIDIGLQKEAWISFMRSIQNGSGVYKAIRYARRKWKV